MNHRTTGDYTAHNLLDGHLALVTGAAEGNGRAIALGLAQAGADVVLTDINQTKLRQTKEEVIANGGMAWEFLWDVSDSNRAFALAQQVQELIGKVSILVNNAGILLRTAIDSQDLITNWNATFDVNVNGSLYATRAFLDHLKSRHGCIINMASVLSYAASSKNTISYITSKGAILQFTRALAFELAPSGVRVNAIAPGIIETSMNESARKDPSTRAQMLTHIPMNRFGQPCDLAGAAVFLASKLASYITGIVLPVDGGYLTV